MSYPEQFQGFQATNVENWQECEKQSWAPRPFQDVDVDIKVEACGVCASDKHKISGDWDPERRRCSHTERETGMVVVAAGKFGDENMPFVTIMETEVASKVMSSGQGLQSELLRKARDRVRTDTTESSILLSFRREEGSLTLSVKLEEDVADGERVSCLDFAAQVVRGK
ncbi:hypothetical protein NQ176_g9172 [Zarea fungicola]|uniref:Uncharacterized protein n=1 Tax=Zarea fungicola TaxID=93591 RepID=A0ACC1MPA7_9HYPO|nr:hypothetical protein NQ176_g9172 [Lecanicillium fungicola]